MPKNDYQLTARASKASDPEPVKSLDLDEPLKFSVRREMAGEGGNSKRIIIFIVIVVALGLGLTLLVQSFINNQGQQSNGNTTSTSSTEPEISIPGVEIGDEVVDDGAATRQIENSQYTDSQLSLGSASNAVAGINLEKLTYTPYDTFSELKLELTDTANGLPSTAVSYLTDSDSVVVAMTGIGVANLEMLQTIEVNAGNVFSITPSNTDTGVSVTIKLVEPGKYFAAVVGTNGLSLYFKTDSDFATISSSSETTSTTTSASTSTTTSTPATTSSTTSSTPAGSANFDNDAGQGKQSIVSSVTDNKLVSETYYYVDGGNNFTFSWAIRGEGDSSVPNATAEYITDGGKNYIEVKINNLAFEIMHNKGREKAIINISTASSNLVDVFTKGMSNGTATFWIEVRAKKDFRLYSNEDFGGYRLLSIQLFD